MFYPAETPVNEQSAERRRHTLRQRLVALPGGSAHRTTHDETDDDATDGVAVRSTVRAATPLHIVRTWDADARLAAWEQAQDAAERDPDAARYLLDCLNADISDEPSDDEPVDETSDDFDSYRARDREDDEYADELARVEAQSRQALSARPFDPMRLFARLVRYYRFAHYDLMRMPWRTLLGYAREADIMTQEEQARLDAEMSRGRSRYGAGGYGGARDADGLAALNSLPRVR